MKKINLMSCFFILLVFCSLIALPITAFAATQITSGSFSNFRVEMEQTRKTDPFSIDGGGEKNYVQSRLTWSHIATDLTSGYSTTLKLDKKSLGIYFNKGKSTITDPTTTLEAYMYTYDVGKGTFRYQIYNDSLDSTMTLKYYVYL